jgi:hypothetical protein
MHIPGHTNIQRGSRMECQYTAEEGNRYYCSAYIHTYIYTVGPRFTNAPVDEQFGSRTNFPSKKRLG